MVVQQPGVVSLLARVVELGLGHRRPTTQGRAGLAPRVELLAAQEVLFELVGIDTLPRLAEFNRA